MRVRAYRSQGAQGAAVADVRAPVVRRCLQSGGAPTPMSMRVPATRDQAAALLGGAGLTLANRELASARKTPATVD